MNDCVEIAHELSGEHEIAVDIESLNEGRNGRISIIQIASKRGDIFIFDIVRLGTKAFSEGGLSFLFYSHKVRKVIFDSRIKCLALFHQHNVTVKNIFDLQVFHFLKFKRKTVTGFERCLIEAAPLLNITASHLKSIKKIKKKGLSLLSPGCEGFDEIWKVRPINEYFVVYAAADVMTLLPMKDAWERTSPPALIERVENISQDRTDVVIRGIIRQD
eukprot:CAMPEP_0194271580 /NCGR_PEP_ID=MMETSP0169-20130528/5325_1 /TAXON_ID=218684 /ORGANISM="Corethron pennatum, Strain L29A3" /LENGTH=216 /DNA_ID=CAMNT_0039013955 /DNA_START=198 /DNA_END=848 /DNA_ORIENTATION=-